METDTDTIELHVYRDLSNRVAGEPDDGPMAREAHRRRAQALHEDLKAFNVTDWGLTDDAKTHELVALIVGFLAAPAVKAAVVPALAFIGGILSESFKAVVADGVKSLLTSLIGRIREPKKSVQDFWIVLPDKTQLKVDANATIQLTLKSGKLVSLNYDASDQEVMAEAKKIGRRPGSP